MGFMDLLELHVPDRLPLLVEKASKSEVAALRLMRHRLSGSQVVAELLNGGMTRLGLRGAPAAGKCILWLTARPSIRCHNVPPKT